MIKKLLQRFAELEVQAAAVAATERVEYSEYAGGHSREINYEALIGWKVKAKSLLEKVCGPESQHMKAFVSAEDASYTSSVDILKRCLAVFLAAKEDYEGGYLDSVGELVRAEVFDHELEQANELLNAGYSTAAAVVAGVVLETTLRALCEKNGLMAHGMERMNQDLAKTGVYTVLVQKQVTQMAHVRNKAAHGEQTEFTDDDVRKMVGNVSDFVAAMVVA